DVLEPGLIDATLLDEAPDRGLALALDLLLSGDVVRGGEFLDQAVQDAPSADGDVVTDVGLGLARSMRLMLTGRAEEARAQALAVRDLIDGAPVAEEWTGALSLTLLRVSAYLQDYDAVDREARATEARSGLAEPVKVVMLPGLEAQARVDEGRLEEAAALAEVA